MLSSNEYEVKSGHQNQQMENIKKEMIRTPPPPTFMHLFADHRNAVLDCVGQFCIGRMAPREWYYHQVWFY